MIDVTFRFESARKNPASGIVFVKLRGEEMAEWVVGKRPNTPAGFVAINGIDNGSYRWVSESAIEKAINDQP